MREAVIVSVARTPIGKAYRGAFNATHGPTLGGHSIEQAVARAGIDPGEVDDVVIGCAAQQGTTGGNIARQAALRAGLPQTVSAMSLDRQCASGLMAISIAAKQIVVDRMDVCVAGGVESISLVQTKEMRTGPDPELLSMHNGVYMPMIDTAEVVGEEDGRLYRTQHSLVIAGRGHRSRPESATPFRVVLPHVLRRDAEIRRRRARLLDGHAGQRGGQPRRCLLRHRGLHPGPIADTPLVT